MTFAHAADRALDLATEAHHSAPPFTADRGHAEDAARAAVQASRQRAARHAALLATDPVRLAQQHLDAADAQVREAQEDLWYRAVAPGNREALRRVLDEAIETRRLAQQRVDAAVRAGVACG